MTRKPDDWKAKGTYLTPEEIEFLHTKWRAGVSYYVAARAIRCSSRIASKYYADFHASGDHGWAKAEEPPKPVVLPVGGSEFIRPLTRAELMRGRA